MNRRMLYRVVLFVAAFLAAAFVIQQMIESRVEPPATETTETEVPTGSLDPMPNLQTIQVDLTVVADGVAQYRLSHDGDYPESLETFLGEYNFEPELVYRAGDLEGDVPAEMVLAYEKFPDRPAGLREVLFAGRMRRYFVDGEPVSQAEYEEAYDQILKSRDPENSMLADDAILFRNWEQGGWITKVHSEPVRVLTLGPGEFAAAIARDNEIRTELGLPTKPAAPALPDPAPALGE